MRKHLQAEADFYRRRRHTKQLLPDSVVLAESGQGKGAEAVARNIARAILSEGLQPGELVGTEPAWSVGQPFVRTWPGGTRSATAFGAGGVG